MFFCYKHKNMFKQDVKLKLSDKIFTHALNKKKW